MIRLLARWWAKRCYIFQLELEASKGLINAAIAKRNADDARELVEQLNAEADAIDKNIEAEGAKQDRVTMINGQGFPNSSWVIGHSEVIARSLQARITRGSRVVFTFPKRV